jgi:hypothetical protein
MRKVIQKTKIGKGEQPGTILKIVLFWTIFIFIVFLMKRVLGYSKRNFDFIINFTQYELSKTIVLIFTT